MRSAAAKIIRAKRHLQDWEKAAAEYWASEPYRLESKADQEANQLHLVVRVQREPPEELALIAADVVHNARSALDHIAYQLVLDGGGVPVESTYFPITAQETGWGDRARKDLRGATHAARQAVRALAPWRGGDDALWQLHHLDIIDKHRLLFVVLGQYRGIVIGGNSWRPWPDDPDSEVVLPEIALNAAKREAVHDGFIAYSEPLDKDEDGPMSGLPKVTLELAFGPGVEVSGEPVGEVLARVLEAAERAVERIAAT